MCEKTNYQVTVTYSATDKWGTVATGTNVLRVDGALSEAAARARAVARLERMLTGSTVTVKKVSLNVVSVQMDLNFPV